MKKVLLVAVAMLFLGVSNVHALVIPTINGADGGAGEWADYLINATDVAESNITDNWDIKEVWMKVVTGQVSGNGTYFRMDMYAAPAYTGAPGAGSSEAYFEFWMDLNGDNVEDYYIDLNDQQDSKLRLLGLYQVGSPDVKLGFGTVGFGSIIEMYIPDSLFSTSLIDGNFGLYAAVDPRGTDADDRLPGEGFVKTPEPGSAMLLGMGLLSVVGVIRRKFMA